MSDESYSPRACVGNWPLGRLSLGICCDARAAPRDSQRNTLHARQVANVRMFWNNDVVEIIAAQITAPGR
jgi:hypothetical protein